MIEYTQGDLFEDDSEALVNTVNCIGIMGGGIALEFKKRWPSMYAQYRSLCERRGLTPGMMHVYSINDKPVIINFPTKGFDLGPSKMEDIESGLKALANTLLCNKIRSVAIPALGCGLGGLKWPDVKAKIEEILGPISEQVRIRVYEPLEVLRFHSPRLLDDVTVSMDDIIRKSEEANEECLVEDLIDAGRKSVQQEDVQISMAHEIIAKRAETLKKLA